MRMNLIHIKEGETLPTNSHDVAFVQVASIHKGMISIDYPLRPNQELLEAGQGVMGDPIARLAPCS